MSDLTKLTRDQIGVTEWHEILRRLERLAKCEAALRRIATEHISYDDPAVAGAGQYSIGVTDGHRCAANIARAALEDRPCTCHPDDNPPRPCPKKYAYSECVDAARAALEE